MTRKAFFGPRSRVAALLAVGALGALAWLEFGLSLIRPALVNGLYPTSTYWVAPRLVWEGRSAALFDTEEFGRLALELGANFDRGFIPNAPPALLPLLPFGLLTQQAAFAVWTALSVAALLAAVALLLRRLQAPVLPAVAVIAALPLFAPVRANFAFGQAFTFLLLALVLAALPGRSRSRDVVTGGLSLGAAAIIKAWYGAAAIAAAFVAGRWRAAGTAVALFAAVSVASLAIVGVDGWKVWIETSLTWRQRPETSVTAYQTLHSLTSHLFRFDPAWNHSPAADAPLLAEILWLAAVGALAGVTYTAIRRSTSWWRAQRSAEAAALPLALTVPAAILASPIAEDYHYVLTLLSFVVGGWTLFRYGARRASSALLLASLLLIGLPLPFNQQSVDGWWALLFYPRVYGALALWLSLVLLSRSSPTDRAR